MGRQRGFITDGWLILIALAVIAGGLWYAYQTIDSRGYARGKTETEAIYAKRDNDALVKANAEIAKLREQVRKTEQTRAAEIQAASEQLQKGNADAQRTIADLRRRVVAGERLRDPGASCPGSSGSGLSKTPSGTSGSDGGTGAYLSGEATVFLFDLTAEADAVTRQLRACQSILKSERK